ncbi:nucleotidyl transferase AbiEii/AbiGii toxin family protein [Paraburkholderia dipogonis]|nr:nucleotidyl transferase AbiEii/AbiGii toxin family protein [Paraburkholderia dipogonis]
MGFPNRQSEIFLSANRRPISFAALVRQHPRDICDVQHMYDTYGPRQDVVTASVGYVADHNRPVHEVLFAKRRSLEDEYEAGFVGMTVDQVELAALQTVQARLHYDLPRALTEERRQFLASLVRLEPDWSLMPYDHLRDLPPIRWKIENLVKLRTRDAPRPALLIRARSWRKASWRSMTDCLAGVLQTDNRQL